MTDIKSWRAQGDADGFDELVIGSFFHLEAMDLVRDTAHYWLKIGDRTFDFFVDRNGKVELIEQGK